MFKKILLLFIFGFPALVFAQKMKRCVVGSAGFSGQTSSVKIRATVAQPPNAGTDFNGFNYLRQGFQQPLPQNEDCADLPNDISFEIQPKTVSCNETFDFFYSGQNTANLTFLWQFGQGAVPSTSTEANPKGIVYSIPGTYQVTLTVSVGDCSDTYSESLTSASTPLAAPLVNKQDVDCFGDSTGFLTVSISGGLAPYSLLWNTGDTSRTLLGIPAGEYSFVLTDANDCEHTGSISIAQPDTFSVEILGNLESCTNNVGNKDGALFAVVDGGTAPYFYDWSTGEVVDSATTLSAGLYGLTVTDSKGCVWENGEIELEGACDLELNNFISPNDDGYNDVWVLPINAFDRTGVQVFNRYGSVVYKNEDYKNNWSGTNTAGEPLPFGAYFFAIEFIKEGNVTLEKGSITILR